MMHIVNRMMSRLLLIIYLIIHNNTILSLETVTNSNNYNNYDLDYLLLQVKNEITIKQQSIKGNR